MPGPPVLPGGQMVPLLAVVLAAWPGGQLTTLTKLASSRAPAGAGTV
jgi:hypothetical protein